MGWSVVLMLIVNYLNVVEPVLKDIFGQLLFTIETSTPDNISISCSFKELNQDSVEKPSFEIIGFKIKKNIQSQWKTIAEIFKTDPTHVYLFDPRITEATGSVVGDGQQKRFIKLYWKTSETSSYGEYRCEAIVHKNDLQGSTEILYNKLLVELHQNLNKDEQRSEEAHSPSQVDFNTNISSQDNDWMKTHYRKRSLLSLVDSIEVMNESLLLRASNTVKESIKKQSVYVNQNTSILGGLDPRKEDTMAETLKNMTFQMRNFNKKINETFNLMFLLKSNTNLHIQQMVDRNRDNLFQNYSQVVKDSLNNIINTIYRHTDVSNVLAWPQGTYALLKGSSGCPLSPMKAQQWKEGFKKYHTESSYGNNNDSYSRNSHLVLPIKSIENNQSFMTLHFCVKTDEDRDGPPWPKGSYCISKKDNCSEGFDAGLLRIDEEDNGYLGTSVGVLPENVGDNHSYLKFCCRSDGNPLYPIQLPVFTPFYLYRHGGRCQNVLGMSVTEEYVYIDTENSSNRDSKQSPHADGSINNINITLCYYETL